MKRALLITLLATPAISFAQLTPNAQKPKPEAQKQQPPMAAGKAASTPAQKGAAAKGKKKGLYDKAMEQKKSQ